MDLRAIVTIPYTSGKPEDVAVHVMHFSSASFDEAASIVIRDKIIGLFNTPGVARTGQPVPVSVASFLSNALSREANAVTVKVYNLADPEPRFPITRAFGLAASSAPASPELPAEVALCGSLYAVRSTPRTRGRIYFGPFHTGATEDDAVNHRSRPSLVLRESLAQALRRMITPAAGQTQDLAIYTRGRYTINKVPQAPVPGAMQIVTAGWVDDAWDTQRRRGQDAAVRTTFNNVP